MKFTATLDKPARNATIAITLFLIATITYCIFTKSTSGFILIPFILFAYFSGLFHHAKYYEVNETSFAIKHLFTEKVVAKSSIKSVQLIDNPELFKRAGLMGMSPFFGYVGNYANKKAEPIQWYASQKEQLVLIELNDHKKFMVSPDDASGFIKALGAGAKF